MQETQTMNITAEIIDMIVSHEDGLDIAILQQRGEKPGINTGWGDPFLLHASEIAGA